MEPGVCAGDTGDRRHRRDRASSPSSDWTAVIFFIGSLAAAAEQFPQPLSRFAKREAGSRIRDRVSWLMCR